MRLINIFTGEMREFSNATIPQYGILSHCWGEEEVSLKDYLADQARGHPRRTKVTDFCQYLRQNPRKDAKIEWAWVDTCCIDKESSAELSEAINTMYRWYDIADFCVAHLADVTATTCGQRCEPQCESCSLLGRQLEASRWFRRGWTLQEMIAPYRLRFVSADWQDIGYKGATWDDPFMMKVASITNIPMAVLVHRNAFRTSSIAQRLSWMADRKTTREEDVTYCLLGLLGINMPLLYGEGHRAWIRLQHEIIRQSNDETLFAWKGDCSSPLTGILSGHPNLFESAQLIENRSVVERAPYSITNQGLEMKLKAGSAFVFETTNYPYKTLFVPLNCCIKTPGGKAQPCLLFLKKRFECGHYDMTMCNSIEAIRAATFDEWLGTPNDLKDCKDETIYIHTSSANACTTGDRSQGNMPDGLALVDIRASLCKVLEAPVPRDVIDRVQKARLKRKLYPHPA